MLFEFGLKNFFCFKEGVTISFRLDKNCPDSISKGKNFNSILCIKGANASGKTHVLKGLSFLGWFCSASFQQKPEANVGTLPYFSSKKPSELYAEFAINGITYRYELIATGSEVRRETIYRTQEKRIKVLERKNNELVFRIDEFEQLDIINLRNNASIISTANQYQINVLDDVFRFFNNITTNVNFGGLAEIQTDIKLVSAHLNSDNAYLTFVKSFIAECDVGISDVKISSTKNENGETEYFPIFIHDCEDKKYSLGGVTESSGTKTLFKILPRYKIALDTGGILILDEFDIHFHPHILPKLLQLFEDQNINKKNAQFLFTTHDSDILNYLGRYRTYLVNKECNASYAYRLDEIPGDILRNDRPILPAYNDGKIGGIPNL